MSANKYFTGIDEGEVRVSTAWDTLNVTLDGGSSWVDLSYETAHALADWIIANVPKPEPIWHSAKPGEVWELTYGGQPTAHVYTDRWAGEGTAFVSDRAIVSLDDPDITSGRRIWPERVES